ncbi:hypothetical protein GCM10027284_15930 [Cyclobacterium sediminis]
MAGIGADAVKKDYKTYFKTMEEVINILKFKEMISKAMSDYGLWKKTCFSITTNRRPTEWRLCVIMVYKLPIVLLIDFYFIG